MNSREDFSLDRLDRFDLTLKQPRDGYRYSLDALLLARFASDRPAGRILELGAGCGVISLVLARLNAPQGEVVAVEANPAMAALAAENCCGNGLADAVQVVAGDILDLRSRFADSGFDLVVSNPPYRVPGSGRLSPRAGRDTARHESTAGLADFLATAKYQVSPKGRICFIHHPSRLLEFMAVASGLKLSLTRLQMVHGKPDAPARMFLAELAKGRRASPHVEPPVFARNSDGSHSGDVWR